MKKIILIAIMSIFQSFAMDDNDVTSHYPNILNNLHLINAITVDIYLGFTLKTIKSYFLKSILMRFLCQFI